jgi:NAD dependent epimerase/dehydratase family enzyme
LLFLLDRDGLDGPFNVCSPHPVRNRDLSRALGRAFHRPAFLRTPGFLIRLVLGPFGNVILRGQKTVPRRLLEAGYSFRRADLEYALAEILKN